MADPLKLRCNPQLFRQANLQARSDPINLKVQLWTVPLTWSHCCCQVTLKAGQMAWTSMTKETCWWLTGAPVTSKSSPLMVGPQWKEFLAPSRNQATSTLNLSHGQCTWQSMSFTACGSLNGKLVGCHSFVRGSDGGLLLNITVFYDLQLSVIDKLLEVRDSPMKTCEEKSTFHKHMLNDKKIK